jgi:imidazole glycerol-phosphate synthase subunit HisF
MLKKRIIPCLDVRDGRTVKGIHFEGIRDAGDAVELAQRYVQEGADELVFLDITATIERRTTLVSLVKKVARAINIPFTVGGGIATLDDARAVIRAGADKVSINSVAVQRPTLISEIAAEFGNQCVVVAIDTKQEAGHWQVYIHGGRTPVGLDCLEWALRAQALGAGEILLTSINNDGAKTGFALDICQTVSHALNIPVIASGGAGKIEDFEIVFKQTQVSAALAASVFHFGEISIPLLKQALDKKGVSVRKDIFEKKNIKQ